MAPEPLRRGTLTDDPRIWNVDMKWLAVLAQSPIPASSTASTNATAIPNRANV
jgi:hypothetical protein